MDPRWPAALALATGVVLLALDAPPPDESTPESGAQPDAAQSPPEGAEAEKFQRFQLDPNFKSFEVTPPPPLNPPDDGTKPQTISPPPANPGPPP